jgi:hypothetical protein
MISNERKTTIAIKKVASFKKATEGGGTRFCVRDNADIYAECGLCRARLVSSPFAQPPVDKLVID